LDLLLLLANRVRGTNEEKDKIIPEEDESKAK